FVVQHIMWNADPLGNIARIVNVLTGAACALAMGRRAMVVELQRDADDVVTLRLQQRRRHRGIDAARHGDNHAGVLGTAFEIKTVTHGFTSPRALANISFEWSFGIDVRGQNSRLRAANVKSTPHLAATTHVAAVGRRRALLWGSPSLR